MAKQTWSVLAWMVYIWVLRNRSQTKQIRELGMCLTLDLTHDTIMHELPIMTQDMRLVQELFPRTIWMDEGNIVADGLTMEILENEELLTAHGREKL